MEENKVAFDTMNFIELALSEESKQNIIDEWKNTIKNTRFHISSKVIDEAFGVMVNKLNIDHAEVKNKIAKVNQALNIQVLQYDKSKDNKAGFELYWRYREKFNEECDIPDARIVAHYKRESMTVIYSEEDSVRTLAEMCGMKGRKLPRDIVHQKSR
ncbi:MAG: hypothetical protein AABW61_02880 [Candidatus Aenigmatarchaeota archaeon]